MSTIKMSRGFRNNNPFNIKKGGFLYTGEKEVSSDSVFRQFFSLEYGLRAGFVLTKTYFKKHGIDTIRGFVSRFAPSSENNVDKYINFVVDFCNDRFSNVYGYGRFESDKKIDFSRFCSYCLYAVLVYENGINSVNLIGYFRFREIFYKYFRY